MDQNLENLLDKLNVKKDNPDKYYTVGTTGTGYLKYNFEKNQFKFFYNNGEVQGPVTPEFLLELLPDLLTSYYIIQQIKHARDFARLSEYTDEYIENIKDQIPIPYKKVASFIS